MGLKKKILGIGLVAVMLAGVTLSACFAPMKPVETTVEVKKIFTGKDTLYFWYSDAALTDYLTNVSASYYEKSGYHVIPVLRTGLEYLEEINDSSVHWQEGMEQMPDLYIISNDSLEKAYLAGLAAAIKDKENICTTENFPQTALDAVTYHGKRVAYPFYYETTALLYNKTYMEEAGKRVPDTIEGILNFADEYDAPEQVEAVFKWDVSDIFYNYHFVGNYMRAGGEAGDNPSNIDIDNEKTRECLSVYQSLNQFFSIETKEVSYDSVLQEFIDGKIVMTIATSDAIEKLENAKREGNFSYEYGIAKMPNLTDSLKGRSLSVTNGIVINGYSEKGEAANDFAGYLTMDHSQELYAQTGKIASRYGITYDNANVDAFMQEYKKSISMPKMLGTSNFWVQLEICFAKIWSGESVEELLKAMSEQINSQITD